MAMGLSLAAEFETFGQSVFQIYLMYGAVSMVTVALIVLEMRNSSTCCACLLGHCFRRQVRALYFYTDCGCVLTTCYLLFQVWLPYRWGAFHRALLYQALGWVCWSIAMLSFVAVAARSLLWHIVPKSGSLTLIGTCLVMAVANMATSVSGRIGMFNQKLSERRLGGFGTGDASAELELIMVEADRVPA